MEKMTTQQIIKKVQKIVEQSKVKTPTPPKLKQIKQVSSVKLPQLSPIFTAKVI